MQICKNIEQVRLSKNLGVTDVAKKMGITRTTYANYEHKTEPSMEVLKRIAIALEVPAYTLLAGVIDFEDVTVPLAPFEQDVKLTGYQWQQLRASLSVLDSIFGSVSGSKKGSSPGAVDIGLSDNTPPLRVVKKKGKQKDILP